uniref:Uncharacterized protein n=1 Tax=Sipha flava TaxID=143950 RepID=A0A2S2QQ62_9HEMI
MLRVRKGGSTACVFGTVTVGEEKPLLLRPLDLFRTSSVGVVGAVKSYKRVRWEKYTETRVQLYYALHVLHKHVYNIHIDAVVIAGTATVGTHCCCSPSPPGSAE